MPLVRLDDEEDPVPNLAPMIDVILVLTIFFMCATKFSGDERTFDLDLPQASSAAAVQGPRPEILEVFQITKLNKVFDIRAEEAEAVAAFV